MIPIGVDRGKEMERRGAKTASMFYIIQYHENRFGSYCKCH